MSDIHKDKIVNHNCSVFKQWTLRCFYIWKLWIFIFLLAFLCFITVRGEVTGSPGDTTDVKMQYSLDEVKITASKMLSVNSKMARLLTVIDSKDIEMAPVENIQDLLEYYISADVRQRGAEGVQADIGIRGGTFDQTLLLINGINVTDPQTGHHSLNLPVSIEQIERIEFLKGTEARKYSPDAFSGAINIVTRQPAGNSIDILFDGGSHSYLKGGLAANFMTGKISHSASGNYKSSGGYIPNTDFRISNLFYSGRYDSGKGKLYGQAGITGKSFGANSFYSPKYPDQFEQTRTTFMALRWESPGWLHFNPAVYFRRHTDEFMLFRNAAPDWYAGHNYHRTDVWGGNFSSWFLWGAGKTSFGSGIRSEKIISNNLGEPMEEHIKVPGEDAFYTLSKKRLIVSGFIEHVIYFNHWSFNAGVLANRISDNESGVNFFPGIDIGYQLLSELRLEASWSNSLRMPAFTDLYYSGPVNIGNPNLKPEISNTYEAGFRLNSAFIKVYSTLFYRRGRNMIDWVKRENEELWQSRNLTRINSMGTEIHLQLPFNTCISDGWPDINLGWYYNKQEKDAGNYISHYLLDNLKYKFIASVNQKICKNIFMNISSYYQEREGTYTSFSSNNESNEISYQPFWLFDAKILYKQDNLQLFISTKNIFNKKYFDIGNIVAPGRWIKAGISYKFKIN